MNLTNPFQDIYAAGCALEEIDNAIVPYAYAEKSAAFEITLNIAGDLINIREIAKESEAINIPVTEESEGRTGVNPSPFPLAEQIKYLSEEISLDRYKRYMEQIEHWSESEYTHPFLTAIISYLR